MYRWVDPEKGKELKQALGMLLGIVIEPLKGVAYVIENLLFLGYWIVQRLLAQLVAGEVHQERAHGKLVIHLISHMHLSIPDIGVFRSQCSLLVGREGSHQILFHQDQGFPNTLFKGCQGIGHAVEQDRTFSILCCQDVTWRKCPTGDQVRKAGVQGRKEGQQIRMRNIHYMKMLVEEVVHHILLSTRGRLVPSP
ncbi:hypothetical protein SDC9_158353 [bioreactor metagenome]|uniref:Uncharacterized protein n=1 Tax=bioreactor metagenome TaxID=1076179 RepID=A0A645FBW1_9ZZZZ